MKKSMIELQMSVDPVLSPKESAENLRRLDVQSSLNRRGKVFALHSWYWGAGLSIPNALTPVSGMSVRDVALKLDEVDPCLASAVIDYQLNSQIEFFYGPKFSGLILNGDVACINPFDEASKNDSI
jgi:hypothetical protein